MDIHENFNLAQTNNMQKLTTLKPPPPTKYADFCPNTKMYPNEYKHILCIKFN